MTLVFRVDPGVPYWVIFLLLLLFMPTSVLAGCMFSIVVMPETMRKIAGLLPQYWLLNTFGELQVGNSLGSLYVNLLILAAFALTFTLLTIYKFGRNNDARTFV